ncbi:DNA glycosylase [Globomyces pollinis-pini]|nr:DNA glycosylase [Globomyces pollinis-pini]
MIIVYDTLVLKLAVKQENQNLLPIKNENCETELSAVKWEEKINIIDNQLPLQQNVELQTGKPPKNWLDIYSKLKEFRDLNQADVDTVGCAMLGDRSKSPAVYRYHILTSLQLSSQTKDPVTAKAITDLKSTPEGLTPYVIQKMDSVTLDQFIQKVGFHNRKTIYLKKTADILIEKYNGDIPSTLEGLLELPGVGPKMAYLTMQEAWGTTLGIGVDTHVHRISNRLGWVNTMKKGPEHTRKELEDWLPKEYWRPYNQMLVGFGQIMCKPVGPSCTLCPVRDLCPKIGTKSMKK